MVIDDTNVLQDHLLDGEEGHLQEEEELPYDQPDVHQPHVGGGRQFLYHTKDWFRKSLELKDEREP